MIKNIIFSVTVLTITIIFVAIGLGIIHLLSFIFQNQIFLVVSFFIYIGIISGVECSLVVWIADLIKLD